MRCVIVDLDGTLCMRNSFYIWVRSILSCPFPKQALLGIWIAFLGVARAFSVISHGTMKRLIMEAYNRLLTTAERIEVSQRTAERVLENTDKRVLQAINFVRERNFPVLLATAAPQSYAEVVAMKLGLSGCVGTLPPMETTWLENVGEVKSQSVRLWLLKKGCAELPLDVLTDHKDDLPLARMAECVVWLGKSKLSSADGIRADIFVSTAEYCRHLRNL